MSLSSLSNSSIRPIDKTLSSDTSANQNRPGSDGNERIFHITQSFKTATSPLNCLMLSLGSSSGSLILLQRCTQFILQTQHTWQSNIKVREYRDVEVIFDTFDNNFFTNASLNIFDFKYKKGHLMQYN